MMIDELIAAGVCTDDGEALQMFPLEMLDEFMPARRTGCPRRPTCARPATGRCPGGPQESQARPGEPTLGNGLRPASASGTDHAGEGEVFSATS